MLDPDSLRRVLKHAGPLELVMMGATSKYYYTVIRDRMSDYLMDHNSDCPFAKWAMNVKHDFIPAFTRYQRKYPKFSASKEVLEPCSEYEGKSTFQLALEADNAQFFVGFDRTWSEIYYVHLHHMYTSIDMHHRKHLVEMEKLFKATERLKNAAENGDVDEANSVLNGPDLFLINAKFSFYPILNYAIKADSIDVVAALVEHGVSLKGDTFLITEATSGNTQIVDFFLDHGLSADQQMSDGDSVLHILVASFEPDIPMAEFLISRGANVNAKNDRGETPLFRALHADMVSFLIQNGAEVNLQASNGRTALHQSIINDHVPATIALLEHGVDVNIPDDDGKTPLFYARRMVVLDHFLNSHMVDLDHQDHDGFTLMHHAVLDDINLLEVLLKHGANPNLQNNKGHTPLFLADDVHCVRLLLSSNADIDIRDKDGLTAMEYHRSILRADIADMIQNAKKERSKSIEDIFRNCKPFGC